MPTPPPNPALLQEASRRAALRREIVATIYIDDQAWTLAWGDVSALAALRFRDETNRDVDSVEPIFGSRPGFATIALAAYLAQVVAKSPVRWSDFGERVTIGSAMEVTYAEIEDDLSEDPKDLISDPLPQAPAA